MNSKTIALIFGLIGAALLILALSVPVIIILHDAKYSNDQIMSAMVLGLVGLVGVVVGFINAALTPKP